MAESFYFLPEVDLYTETPAGDVKEEIDILCVIEGKFCAVEVKKTATQLTKKPEAIEKFIRKIKTLRPDIAILSFESLSDEPNDFIEVRGSLNKIAAQVKAQSGISKLQLQIFVADEIDDFRKSSNEIGIDGPRCRALTFY